MSEIDNSHGDWHCLDWNVTLRVDELVPLSLLPILEQASSAQQHHDIQCSDAEYRCENEIKEVVCEVGNWRDTSSQACCHKRVGAGVVLHEWRRLSIHVTTALELLLQKTLHLWGLVCPESSHVGPCSERLEPNNQADNHGENSAEDDSVSVKSEDCAVGLEDYGRYGEEEGGKDEDGVDSSGCKKDRMSIYFSVLNRMAYRSMDSGSTGGFGRHWKWSG